MRQRSRTFGKRLPIALATIALALVYSLTVTGPTPATAAFTPCQDECDADFWAQRYACAHSGLSVPEVIQCYHDAQDAFELCMESCQ